MTLDGAGAPDDGSSKLPSPTVHGDNVAFISNEVTNGHTAICFAVGNESYGRAYNVEIRGNRIHDCGVLPPTNHQHGIYLHSPCCAQVTDNWIHDNADTGVNLFPNADDNYFARNVIHGNGDNLSFAGRSKGGVCESSDNNLIENNVMTSPRVRKNITSWSPCGSHGTGNVLRRNCIYPATFEGTEGYALQNNLHVDPQYVDPANADFRLRAGSPCAPLLDHPDLPGTGPLPVPGIRPVAPPIGQRFGVSQGQLPGGKPAGGGAGAVTLRALRRFVRPGGRVVLVGRVSVPGHGRCESCCAAAADGLACVPSARRATAASAPAAAAAVGQQVHRASPACPAWSARPAPGAQAGAPCAGPGRRALRGGTRAAAPLTRSPGLAFEGLHRGGATAVGVVHRLRHIQRPHADQLLGGCRILASGHGPGDAEREAPVHHLDLAVGQLGRPGAEDAHHPALRRRVAKRRGRGHHQIDLIGDRRCARQPRRRECRAPPLPGPDAEVRRHVVEQAEQRQPHQQHDAGADAP